MLVMLQTTWTAGTLGIADTLGNTLANSQQISLNGKLDLIPFIRK